MSHYFRVGDHTSEIESVSSHLPVPRGRVETLYVEIGAASAYCTAMSPKFLARPCMHCHIGTLALIFTLGFSKCSAAEFRINVTSSGAPVPGAQLTIHSLEDSKMSNSTFTTDKDGWATDVRLVPGLYQCKAQSHGFMNTVTEIFVTEQTQAIDLHLRPRIIIDYVTVPSSEHEISRSDFDRTIQIRLLFSGIEPSTEKRVLFRDSEGNGQRWLALNGEDAAKIALLDDKPLFVSMPMVIVLLPGKVFSFVLGDDCIRQKPMENFPEGATCIDVENSRALIVVPPPAQ